MKNTIWYAILAVLIVIGGVYWFWGRDAVDENSLTATLQTNTDTVNTTGTNTNNNPVGMKTTLGGIFDDPGSHQCDYEQVSQQSRSTNVVYIANGKLRGEFRTQTATETTLSMVVYDGTYLYTWTEGQPTGKVSQPKTLKDLPSVIPEDITSGKILGTSANNVSWNCHDWLKDPKKLVKPTYVKFN